MLSNPYYLQEIALKTVYDSGLSWLQEEKKNQTRLSGVAREILQGDDPVKQ